MNDEFRRKFRVFYKCNQQSVDDMSGQTSDALSPERIDYEMSSRNSINNNNNETTLSTNFV